MTLRSKNIRVSDVLDDLCLSCRRHASSTLSVHVMSQLDDRIVELIDELRDNGLSDDQIVDEVPAAMSFVCEHDM